MLPCSQASYCCDITLAHHHKAVRMCDSVTQLLLIVSCSCADLLVPSSSTVLWLPAAQCLVCCDGALCCAYCCVAMVLICF